MPPRMMTGAARPQPASLRLLQKGGRGSSVGFSKPWRFESHHATAMSVTPERMPGIMPAAKSAGTEACGTSRL